MRSPLTLTCSGRTVRICSSTGPAPARRARGRPRSWRGGRRTRPRTSGTALEEGLPDVGEGGRGLELGAGPLHRAVGGRAVRRGDRVVVEDLGPDAVDGSLDVRIGQVQLGTERREHPGRGEQRRDPLANPPAVRPEQRVPTNRRDRLAEQADPGRPTVASRPCRGSSSSIAVRRSVAVTAIRGPRRRGWPCRPRADLERGPDRARRTRDDVKTVLGIPGPERRTRPTGRAGARSVTSRGERPDGLGLAHRA